MIGAIIFVPWATVPAVKLMTPLELGSTFAVAWLSQLTLLAIFKSTYPNAFSTDIHCFPGSIRQWGWVIPLIACRLLDHLLLGMLLGGANGEFDAPLRETVIPSISGIVGFLLIAIVAAPVLEEMLFRGYILDELCRTMRTPLAVVTQAVLFGLTHWSQGPLAMASITIMGILFGVARVSRVFGGGLAPLILAHSIFNLIMSGPFLASLPEAWPVAVSARCQELDALKSEPAEKAVPIIIEALGSDDDPVIVCAMMLLKRRYSAVAMPALRDAIESKNRSLVFGAIFAWGELGYPELLPGMRRIAEDSSDRGLQACALAELAAHSDGDWIRSLATTAPDERTRRMAWNALGEQPKE
jgi:membrane protease YdiL (CAAX protease family)